MNNQFDVIILGGGLSGAMLGAILARYQHRVLLIDSKSHPRFAIGESTVPQTSQMLKIIADRFDVPEIASLSSPEGIRGQVGSTCGVKRGFGFVYHQDAEPLSLIETVVPDCENHFYRQDTDAYMFHVAVHYGADFRQQEKITGFEITDSSVQVATAGGEQFKARYLIDASGYSSSLARHFNLRETPTRLQHHSRSLFTHMVDVKPYEDCMETSEDRIEVFGGRSRFPWSEGTLHHLFDGGWIWVIPFDNHPNSTNPLCSVGLTLDPRRFPKTDTPPEQEFFDFIARFPSVAAQFEKAKAVRAWISADRLQYSSAQCTGPRYMLTANAAGFVDPLFSRGLANTADIVYVLADRLLQALVDNDFSAERFQYVERLQQGLLDYNDQLVNGAFISFAHPDLWKAWHRLWVFGGALNAVRLYQIRKEYDETGDLSALSDLDAAPYPGLLAPNHEGYKRVFDRSVAIIEAVADKKLAPLDAADQILAQVNTIQLTRRSGEPLKL